MNRANANLFRAGFTLIEIMVAMVVLAILVVMVGNIFQQVSDSWNIGTQSSEANTAGRAAMTFMAQELAQAVAGPIEAAPGSVNTLPCLSFEVANDGADVRFVTLTGEVSRDEDRGALRRSAFYFDSSSNVLRYARQTQRDESYTFEPNHQGVHTLIRNVVDFWMCVYSNRADFEVNQGWSENVRFTNTLPACLDIYLEILSESDMARWQSLGKDDDFRKRNAQCYSTRVFFVNRKGYAAR